MDQTRMTSRRKIIDWFGNNIFTFAVVFGVVGFLCGIGVLVWCRWPGITETNAKYLDYLGAFIGGCCGSLFTLAYVLLMYLTLKEQQQTSRRQSFTGKYYSMLELHRKNLEEIELFNGEKGRKAFVHFLKEYRQALDVVRGKLDKSNPEQVVRAAYLILYYGVGENSDRMLRNVLRDEQIPDDDLAEIIEDAKNKACYAKRVSGETIFDGHQHRLGHYYRHLYQLVNFIDKQEDDVLSQDEKYDYVKTVRAQLSNHEQALLLLNILTPLGREWSSGGKGKNTDFLARYKLVKNIPEGFFHPQEEKELDMRNRFPFGYFEWQQCPQGKANSRVDDAKANSLASK